MVAQVMEFPLPNGILSLNFCLLALAWPSPGYIRHVGCELGEGKSPLCSSVVSLSHSLNLCICIGDK